MKLAFHTLDPFAAVTGVLGSAIGVASLYESEHADLLLALAIGLVVVAAMEWSLSRRFARHEVVELRDKNEMLAAQRDAFIQSVELVRVELKTELSRMSVVFDGMAASYDSASRRAMQVEEGLRRVQDELIRLSTEGAKSGGRFEEDLTKLESRVAILERHVAGTKLGTGTSG